jgi:prepilin peptidase CpaA
MSSLDLVISQTQAIVFGLTTLPITIWIIWTDLTDMKIRNEAVLSTVAIFAIGGLFLMPTGEYALRWLNLFVMMTACFVFYLTFGMGAGDAKYIGSAALFVPVSDAGTIAWLYIVWSILVLTGMALAKHSSILRTAVPNWVWFSPERRGFVPFGLALAPTMTTFFAIASIK